MTHYSTTKYESSSQEFNFFPPSFDLQQPQQRQQINYNSSAVSSPYDLNQKFHHTNSSLRRSSVVSRFQAQPLRTLNSTTQSSNLPDQQRIFRQPFLPSHNTFQANRTNSHKSMLASNTQTGQRRHSHQRSPSTSTIASTSPSSPYNNPAVTDPQIANTDLPPFQYNDYNKFLAPVQNPLHNEFLSAGGYVPAQSGFAPSAHNAMKAFAIDHHNADDFAPDVTHASQPSTMSSQEQNQSADNSSENVENGDSKQSAATLNDNKFTMDVPPLFRTESQQAYETELFNPSLVAYSSTPSKLKTTNHLSPRTSVMSHMLQNADIARSQSPSTAATTARDRSPFRQGSDFNYHPSPVGTAASMRQQQKEQAEQAEYARSRPSLNREPTKTISPKVVELDYNDPDQAPLFQDTTPAGYRLHNGGTEKWPQASFGQSGAMFGDMQQQLAFRSSPSDGLNSNDAYLSTATSQAQIPTHPPTALSKNNTFQASDMTPVFPANLTSMESSGGSIDDSNQNDSSLPPPQRPADTRANKGAYSCVYHNCSARFESPAKLQKHKAEHKAANDAQRVHREVISNDSNSGVSPGTSSLSENENTDESPEPSNTGMTFEAIMARNSQAGPHKCTRINPSTNKPCNTIFSRPYDLTRHEDTIHSGRKQKVRCPICREEKTFSRNDALTRHMRVVHPEAEAFTKRGRRE